LHLHTSDFRGKGHRRSAARAWDAKEFIAWDGEGTTHEEPVKYFIPQLGKSYWMLNGELSESEPPPQPQPYVLLANSKGGSIQRQEGLRTRECFELILDTKKEYPNSIFVGFGFNYDINQILKDLPLDRRERLYKKGTCTWAGYWMEWRPRKTFIVMHRKTKRSAIIYDVFGFFQTSFLKTCKKFLGNDHPDLQQIERGKDARSLFKWEELDEFIAPYNNLELSMLVEIMNRLREDFHSVGIHPSRWHGPGAIANEVLRKYCVPTSRAVPEEVLDASQYAYAGGRFELFWLGRYAGRVYQYDIHSAYPAAATQLPDISDGRWEHVREFEPGTFGVWSVDYRSPGGPTANGYDRPQPLFCRSETGNISYPYEVQGWYWTPEASLVPDAVQEGWVFRPATDARPFAFIKDLYDQRRVFIAMGNPAERAIKLILNSIYGKLAQTVGSKNGKPPRWHQMEYAGYITSYTRAMLYKAIISNPAAIIACETDAVFSTEPLDLPVSDDLGDWELTNYDEITYLQSGFYYAIKPTDETICKYRGMDSDRKTGQPVGLPYGTILDHLHRRTGQADRLTPSLFSDTTRFIGMGMALKTEATWRSWAKEPKRIALDQKPGSSKRYHIAANDCSYCRQGRTLHDGMHPMKIGGYAGESFARKLPWRHLSNKHQVAPINWDEQREMSEDFLVLGELDKWS
jgi:hypothetical protein